MDVGITINCEVYNNLYFSMRSGVKFYLSLKYSGICKYRSVAPDRGEIFHNFPVIDIIRSRSADVGVDDEP